MSENHYIVYIDMMCYIIESYPYSIRLYCCSVSLQCKWDNMLMWDNIDTTYIRIDILTYTFKVYKRYKSLWGGADIKFLWGSILNRLLKWWDGRNPCKGFWKRRKCSPSQLASRGFQKTVSFFTNQHPKILDLSSGNLAYYCFHCPLGWHL